MTIKTMLLRLQGKRAALRSSTLMIRQPLQRLSGMQASDIDIYRRVTREKTANMVRAGSSTGCSLAKQIQLRNMQRVRQEMPKFSDWQSAVTAVVVFCPLEHLEEALLGTATA
jgi:hypothetical protein